ncbi:hypothetical protein [Nocardia jiangxiensis]|uniref:hypothetical protein n=1 Tax=Nocardia jiangxiensis TaxID=282685 RepID=UPI00030E237F|nr:hypothetical protein [Nocardia jiangxiensis]
MTAPRPAEVLALKRDLEELVAQAKGGLSQARWAAKVPVDSAMVTKALKEKYSMPAWDSTGRAIVSKCLRQSGLSEDSAEFKAELSHWEQRWEAARIADRHRPPAESPVPPEESPVPPADSPGRVKPPVWQRKKTLIAGGIVAALVVAAVVVVTDRSNSHASAAPTVAEAAKCVTTGILGPDGRCIAADDPELSGTDPVVQRTLAAIAENNRKAVDAGTFYRIGVPVPIALKSDSGGIKGQLNNIQLAQMLIGAQAAQNQVNDASAKQNAGRAKIQLVMADIGVDQSRWQQPFELMERMAGNDVQAGRLLGVVALNTSLQATNAAAAELKKAQIPEFGPITNAAALDSWIVSMMPTTMNLVQDLDDWYGRQPGPHTAIELLDTKAFNDSTDLYIRSLKADFDKTTYIHSALSELNDGKPVWFDGSTLVPGGQPDVFKGICDSHANTLVYGGRDADLGKLLEYLNSPLCAHRPKRILTIAASLSSADENKDLLTAMGMSVIFASPVDPSKSSGAGWNSYADRVRSISSNSAHDGRPLSPSESPSAYGCLTNDAVLSLTQAIRTGGPGGTPTPSNVRTWLTGINGNPESVPGCSGPVTFSPADDGTITRADPSSTIVIDPSEPQ